MLRRSPLQSQDNRDHCGTSPHQSKFFPSRPSPKMHTSPRNTPKSLQRTAFQVYARYAHWFVLVLMLTFIPLQFLVAVSNEEDILDNTEPPEYITIPPPTHSGPSIRKTDTDSPRVTGNSLVTGYSPSLRPVIPPSVYKPTSARPLRVIFIGTSDRSVFLDGIDRSKYLKVIETIQYDHVSRRIHQHKNLHSNPQNEPLLVVIDWDSLSRDCHILHQIWKEAGLEPSTAPLQRTHFLMIDWSASTKAVTCDTASWFPHDRTRQARRAIVEGRFWNATRDWVEPGHVLQPVELPGGPVLQSPYFLREEFVEKLIEVTSDQTKQRSRKIDISHFWRKGDYSHYSFLRRKVSSEIVNYDESVPEKHLRWVVRRFTGEEWEADQIDSSYVEELISSKIIVISQKDEWEDHYRLMESLASGAMVLSDTMLAPPPGLKNRTNIVFYDSALSLRRLLTYYLEHEDKRKAIARKGFEFVMGRQRSWHAMERIIFGHAFTELDKPTDDAPKRKHPPKQLHHVSVSAT